MRGLWVRFLPRAPIRARIVAAVVAAMSVVLLTAGGFVYWRVSFALDRQLNQDLETYADAVSQQVQAGTPITTNNPDEVSQIFATDGTLIDQSAIGIRPLLSASQIAAATQAPRRLDIGPLLPPATEPYRVRYFTVDAKEGPAVVAAAISRRNHDEALRELLGQLALADLATIIAAGLVGWTAMRAAFGPVESYRRAAAAAGGDPSRRLPVDQDRDDELTRLGTTFNTLLAEIEQSQIRERQFLADASHELRSPLALMAAEVEWVRHRPRTTAELNEVLDSIGGQTDRLVALANALLDLEEISASTNANRTSVALDDVLETALAQARLVAREAGREIRVIAPSTIVGVDRPWVELAIINLAFNALKHGSGTVLVTGDVEREILHLRVVDEGGGIPPSLGDRAFDRFARAEPGRSTPGNGLGLALVRAVAIRHHGSARVIDGGVQIDLPTR